MSSPTMLGALLSLTLLVQPADPAAPLSPAARDAVDGVRASLAAERAQQAAAGPAESVKGELARRVALEQAGRQAMHALFRLPAAEQAEARRLAWAELTPVDQDNVAWLKRNPPQDGWFRISRDGVQAAQGAFLIVQHSGDTAWMKQVLRRLEPLARRREVVPADYALLYDRVAMSDGRPQRYGSQITCPYGGRWDFHPIEDRANVDARRKRLGLEPLADYAKNFPELGQPCG